MFRPIQKVGKLHGFTEYGVRTLLFPLAFLRKIYGLISKRVKSFCACTYVCGIYFFLYCSWSFFSPIEVWKSAIAIGRQNLSDPVRGCGSKAYGGHLMVD